MRRIFLLLALAGALLLACTGVVLAQTTNTPDSSQQPAKGPKGVIPDQYIVVLKDNEDPDTVSEKHKRDYGAEVSHVYKHALNGYAAKIPASKLAKVKADPDVQEVSEDHEVQALQTDSKQPTTETSSKKEATAQVSGPLTSGDTAPTGVRRIEAATDTTAHKASDVGVAVIDTGIQLNHPDLNAVNGKNCVRSNKTAEDDNGHGTHVSGTLAAKNNGSGVVGVAPDTKLYAVKVLNSQGSGTQSQVICGIDWVKGQLDAYNQSGGTQGANIKVANMSLGGWLSGVPDDGNCGTTAAGWDPEHQAICRSTNAGVTFVVAAGNDTWPLEDSKWLEIPGAYDEVLTATAMSDGDGQPGGVGSSKITCRSGESDDKYASFSNWATGPVNTTDRRTDDRNHTIAGPGVCIKSTWKGSSYSTLSGTSMATPHLAGSVALCLGNGGTAGPCAGLSPVQIIQKIRSDAETAQSGTSYGFNGDPLHTPLSGKYFSYLVRDGGWTGAY